MKKTLDFSAGPRPIPPVPHLELNRQLRLLVGGQDLTALRAWREECYRAAEGAYFEARPLMRALQFGGSPWAVLELLAMGEIPTPEMVMRCLDTCVQVAEGGQDRPAFVRQVEVWEAFLDAAVLGDPALKKEAMGFVATIASAVAGPRVSGGLDQEGLDWEQMRLGEVFTPDTWDLTFEWRGPNSQDSEAYLRAGVPVSALQLAWAHECWDVCFHLLRSGLSARQTFPASCWPAWTLEAAMSGEASWMGGVADLALVDARTLVSARAEAGRGGKESPSLGRLLACLREQEMDARLPLARATEVMRRF